MSKRAVILSSQPMQADKSPAQGLHECYPSHNLVPLLGVAINLQNQHPSISGYMAGP